MQIDKGIFTDAGPLFAHPDTPASAIENVTYSLSIADSGHWSADFIVGCPPEQLSLPALAAPQREDDLWQTSCAELFLLDEASGRYFEYNFAPSGKWAAYAFVGYREGRTMLDTPPPDIVTSLPGSREQMLVRMAKRYGLGQAEVVAALRDDEPLPSCQFALNASLAADGPQGIGPWRLGLSMVIEEVCGTKSYWALRHPPGKPDFHHRHCFAIELPSPKRA